MLLWKSTEQGWSTSKKKLKKVLKKCWQCKTRMILYQSCVKQEQHKAPWQINSNATLKILEQSSWNSKKFQKNETINPSRGRDRKRSFKAGNKAKFNLGKDNFLLRVWSWLRMNAGGVPNTCKSNGVMMWAGSACTKQSFHNLVADGWVTRG